jgi:uncharacterized protein involved in oxidation of intracellular sulfur
MDARGLSADIMIKGTERSTMVELAHMTEAADKVLVF